MVYWAERRDLSEREIAAILEWIQSGIGINAYIRDAGQMPPEHRSGMRTYVKELDSAIYKSKLDRESVRKIQEIQARRDPQLYRGMVGPDAEAVLERVRSGDGRIEDAGYQPFTARMDVVTACIRNAAPSPGLVFVAPCTAGETALFIGGSDLEVVYPRNTAWRIRNEEKVDSGNGAVTLMRIGREPAEGRDDNRRKARGKAA